MSDKPRTVISKKDIQKLRDALPPYDQPEPAPNFPPAPHPFQAQPPTAQAPQALPFYPLAPNGSLAPQPSAPAPVVQAPAPVVQAPAPVVQAPPAVTTTSSAPQSTAVSTNFRPVVSTETTTVYTLPQLGKRDRRRKDHEYCMMLRTKDSKGGKKNTPCGKPIYEGGKVPGSVRLNGLWLKHHRCHNHLKQYLLDLTTE